MFSAEHQIGSNNGDEKPVGNWDVSFTESKSGRYVPNAVFVDMDPETIDQLRTEPRKDLYNHQFLISGKEGTGRKSFFKGRTQTDVIDRTRLFILILPRIRDGLKLLTDKLTL